MAPFTAKRGSLGFTTTIMAFVYANPVTVHTVMAQTSQNYTVTDLGSLGGGGGGVGYGVNDNGEVTGESGTSSGYDQAFLYANGIMTDLGTLGGNYSTGTSINKSGEVAGYSDEASEIDCAFLYDSGVLSNLGTLGGNGSVGYGINDSGDVVGLAQTSTGAGHAFLYTGGGMTDLGTLGGTTSWAFGINNSGQVVGYADLANNDKHAFLYANGAMTDLGTTGGAQSQANAIGSTGSVTGWSSDSVNIDTAFDYSGGAMRDLGTLGGTSSTGYGINSSGILVGASVNSSQALHAFISNGSGMTDLNTLISPSSGWTLNEALAISDSGYITGYGIGPDGQEHPFLLTPLLQITEVGIKGQADSKATLDTPGTTATLPFAFGINTEPKEGDTVHWTTTRALPGYELHWKITPPPGGTLMTGKLQGTGKPVDFKVAVAPGDYLLGQRPALVFTVEAWVTEHDSNTKLQDTTAAITQDDLGLLRQEYVDHPLKPVNGSLRRLPDISSFTDTSVNTNLALFNTGNSNRAIIDPWMITEYAAATTANGGTSIPINSAYRDPVKNWQIYQALGASPNASSQHMWGDALDFETSNTLETYVSVAQKVVNTTAQCIWEGTFSHVHVQHFFLGTPRAAALFITPTKVKVGNSAIGTVILSQSASSGSTALTFSSTNPTSNPGLTSVPATGSIAAGSISGTFSIATSNTPPLASSAAVPIAATGGGHTAKRMLTVTP